MSPPATPFYRRRVLWPGLAFALLCVGWTVLWRVVASATEAGLDDWLAREKLAGRTWACGSRDVSGYPFRVEVGCRAPQFSGMVAGVPAHGSVGDIGAAANVYQPSLILAEAASPLAIATDDGRLSLQIAWRRLRVSYHGDGERFERISAEAQGLTGSGAANGASLAGAIDDAQLHLRPKPGGAADDVEAAFEARGARFPALDALTGEAAPLNLDVDAVALHAMTIAPGPRGLDLWRASGGAIDLARAVLTKGELDLQAQGRLALDAQRRATGRLDARLKGGGGLLARFGVPPQALAVGDLLSGLFSSKRDAGPAPEPGVIALPIVLSDGRVAIGPVRTGVRLPPLY